jgi:hypothetical protein
MSKAQLSAALVLVALFGLPATANAATAPVQATSTVSVHTEHEDEEDEFEGQEDGEDGFEHEDGDEDGDDSFVVPPVVIEPKGGQAHPAGPPNGVDQPIDATQIAPPGDVRGEHPVRVDKVRPEHKTPTDIFVDTAVIGLGAVGAGALGLGAVVGVRAIRARRSGEKADYFYGD